MPECIRHPAEPHLERNKKPELTLFFAVGCYAGHRFAKRLREKADENKAKKAKKTGTLLRGVPSSAARLFRRATSRK